MLCIYNIGEFTAERKSENNPVMSKLYIPPKFCPPCTLVFIIF